MRFRLSCAAVLATFFALNAQGQDAVSPEQAGATAALEKRIVQLEERLKKLEVKFEKPMTVRAPFTVADSSGKPVLQVGNTGGRFLTLGPDSAPTFKVSDGGNETLLSMKSGSNAVYLKAGGSGASIMSVTNGKNSVRLISNTGVAVMETVEGGEVAQIGVMDGNSRVKLWKGDKPYFLATAKVDPRLVLGDESNPEFDVMAGPDATTMRVAKADYQMNVGATTHGAEMSVRNVQTGGTTITAKPETSSITVHSANGSDSLEMAIENDEPTLTLNKDSKRIAELGTPESKATGLRFYQPTGELALQAGLGVTGKPAVALFEKDFEAASLSLNKIGEGLLELRRDGEEVAAMLGRNDATKGIGLRIYEEGGKVAVGAGFDKNGVPSVRVMRDDKLAASMEATREGDGLIEVMSESGPAVRLVVAKDNSGQLEVNDDGAEMAAMLNVTKGEGALGLFRSGKWSASLGVQGGSKTAMRIYNDTAQAVAMGLDENNAGALNIKTTTGKKAVFLKADGDGGGSVVTFDAKEAMATGLGIDSNGRGAIEVHRDGQVLATLALGNNGGKLILSNNEGEPMVDAGNIGTVGVVRAGPMFMASGMMGLPGSFLMGRKK